MQARLYNLDSLVPYGFDHDTVDQSTKFCTMIHPLDILKGVPLFNHSVPLSAVPNFTNLKKLKLHLLIQFSMYTDGANAFL